MFERFSDYARRVVVLSQVEARTLVHPEIGSGHLLLALLDEDRGVAAEALAAAGVTRDAAGDALARVLPGGGRPETGNLPFTAESKRALEIALRRTLDLGDRWVTTTQLLLGLLEEPGSTAGQVLDALAVTPDAVRQEALSRSGTAEPTTEAPDRDPAPG
jgi:ATP-dependent Clp protease ATP-binding subunit ClpC